MSQDEFTKLFKYIDDRLNKTEATIATDVASLREEVRQGFDQIAARLDDDDTERAAYEAVANRHDAQIQELANHIGLKLSEVS